jgi:hypothetical protein
MSSEARERKGGDKAQGVQHSGRKVTKQSEGGNQRKERDEVGTIFQAYRVRGANSPSKAKKGNEIRERGGRD